MSLRQLALLLVGCISVLLPPLGTGRKTHQKRQRDTRPGEFLAGSFILTQQSLLEAPYRYAGILREVLDRVEDKQPPSQSDEQNCDVRYRIEPSGRRSSLKIIHNTLSFTLKENNTLVIKAKIDAEVSAKTWIWKGVSFGLLGCLKINSCNGQVVTYKAGIDFQIAIQVFWNSEDERMSIFVKPVETDVHDVNVGGCKPPWYLFWFKRWQTLLNSGVEEAFQQFANNYEHQSDLPEQFSPMKNVFINYHITGMEWSEDFVLFEARGIFFMNINGKNVTFMPSTPKLIEKGAKIVPIPMQGWNMTSRSDKESNLLQGIRLSNEFINAVMWMATTANLTEYRGSARVMDTTINGTISYEPPYISVEKDNRLSLDIARGLLLATCLPMNSSQKEPAILFKAEFSHLVGSGQILLVSSEDKTGVRVTLDSMDLSKLQTKPFEPKLPLPESFESELMKTGITQLQPIINQYLENKPFYLPEKIAPLVASPQVHLFSTGNGTGYIEVMSYCTCASSSRSIFAACDRRSDVCDGESKRKRRLSTTTIPPPTVLTTRKSIKDSFKDGIDKIKEIAGGFISLKDGFKTGNVSVPDNEAINFTEIYELSRNSNLSYVGFHFTFFELSNDCQLDVPGSTAKSYWLWMTSRCSPINLRDQTPQYYFLSSRELLFGCDDADCSSCLYSFSPFDRHDKTCKNIPEVQQSFHVGKPLLHSWTSSDKNSDHIIANVFFGSEFCLFHQSYIEPQVLSTHTNLGNGDFSSCILTKSGNYIRQSLTNNYSIVARADWDCLENCYGCIFKVSDIPVGTCHNYKSNVQIYFTKTVEQVKAIPVEQNISTDQIIYLSVGIVCSFVSLGIVVALFVYCKKSVRQTSASLKSSMKNASFQQRTEIIFKWLRELSTTHLGIRFFGWKSSPRKEIQEDVIQNLMMLVNGILAIQLVAIAERLPRSMDYSSLVANLGSMWDSLLVYIFAFGWNSENNPLVIIHDKFKNDLTISMDILDTSGVTELASKLNLVSYLVNIFNGVLSLLIFLMWCFTITGKRSSWQIARFLSAVSMLASTFIMIAAIIFSTYFDSLIKLEKDKGFLITDNKSMHKFSSEVLKVSLKGLSLTVISFTIVFIFHSVGGGLYTGTVLFRLSHLFSKRPNMEMLTTLLVILTIVQPFVCLHPVIIWSQDSESNSTFLILIILIWFLPVCVHVTVRTVTNQSLQRCKMMQEIKSPQSAERSIPRQKISSVVPSEKYKLRTHSKNSRDVQGSISQKVDSIPASKTNDKSKERKQTFVAFFDFFVQVFQLAFFLASFSAITHYIVNTELSSHHEKLQKFVLPAIISVFVWTVSISYLLLSIVMDETRKDSPLVFKDQNLDPRSLLRASLRRRLSQMDRQDTRRARSLHRQTFYEAAALRRVRNNEFGNGRSTLPPNLDLSESLRGDQIALDASFKINVKNTLALKPLHEDSIAVDTNSETSNDEGTEGNVFDEPQTPRDDSCCGKATRLWNFMIEKEEYRDPQTHGWRIKFRRLCLTIGVIFFSFTTIHSTINTQSYSSKEEIQKILDYTKTNLTWPDSGSALDEVFQVYNDMERVKCYLMIASMLIFWVSIILDLSSQKVSNMNIKLWMLSGGRLANFIGSLMVFASVIVLGLPDYLHASNLDTICPFCGYDFNRMVRQVAEFSIGLFFACLFTFQLFPILVTIAPALVRASVLIVIHPQLQANNNEINNLRMTILQRVIQFSSLLTFPITFISMSIVQQYQQDIHITLIIVSFWAFPPLVLFVGLFYARKYRRYSILLGVYYLYNIFYCGLLASILFYCLTLESVIELIQNLFIEPTFWAGFIAQVFLCNVVISDLLYMTVF